MSTRAAQIELLASPLIDPTTGAVCAGYTAYFYAAGTSTAKNVWTEKEKTNPFTSYALDSGGKILLYGDGIYKIVIKNADGSTVLSLDNQKVQATTFSVVQKTDTYTATPDDDVIICASGTWTLSLQTVANFEHPLDIVNVGSGTITVDPYSTQTIGSSSTIDLASGQRLRIVPDNTSTVWRRTDLSNDINGVELILDADGDTSITADTDDQIDIKVGGTDRAQLTNTSFIIKPGGTARLTVTDTGITLTVPVSGLDLNGTELILDADADTSLTADTDDQIDIRINGSDIGSFKSTGLTLGATQGIIINSIPQGKDVTAATHRKIVEIGDWNMDTTSTLTVAHGLTVTKIRRITAVIRNDLDSAIIPVAGYPSATTPLFIASVDATNVNLGRLDTSVFDSNVDYDATSYNRGWIFIDYVD